MTLQFHPSCLGALSMSDRKQKRQTARQYSARIMRSDAQYCFNVIFLFSSICPSPALPLLPLHTHSNLLLLLDHPPASLAPKRIPTDKAPYTSSQADKYIRQNYNTQDITPLDPCSPTIHPGVAHHSYLHLYHQYPATFFRTSLWDCTDGDGQDMFGARGVFLARGRKEGRYPFRREGGRQLTYILRLER